jgi:hypothetical protein
VVQNRLHQKVGIQGARERGALLAQQRRSSHLPKLSKYREDYYFFSGKTSDVARQLGLAGIVIIWIFKTGDNAKPQLPKELLPPLALFVLGLALDLLHYITSTVIWGHFQRKEEKNLSDLSKDPIVSAPQYYRFIREPCG